jgi:hypothetical protein
MNPTRRAIPKPEEVYTTGTMFPLKTDPRRDIERLNPSAKASSFPLNHFDITADYATFRDSPPSLYMLIKCLIYPKITLPASMIPYDLANPPII